jgi:hypothetical protein
MARSLAGVCEALESIVCRDVGGRGIANIILQGELIIAARNFLNARSVRAVRLPLGLLHLDLLSRWWS